MKIFGEESGELAILMTVDGDRGLRVKARAEPADHHTRTLSASYPCQRSFRLPSGQYMMLLLHGHYAQYFTRGHYVGKSLIKSHIFEINVNVPLFGAQWESGPHKDPQCVCLLTKGAT